MIGKKIDLAVIALACSGVSLPAADLVLKDGRVLRNYRVKNVTGDQVRVEYAATDDEFTESVVSLSQLPPEVAFLFGGTVQTQNRTKRVVSVPSARASVRGRLGKYVKQLQDIPSGSRNERIQAAEDIKRQLEQEISSDALDDEFYVAWVDGNGLLLRVLRDNGDLKTNEYIFVQGARGSSGKLRLKIYPAGIKRRYGSFGSVRFYAVTCAEAADTAVKFVCHAAGEKDLLTPEKTVDNNDDKPIAGSESSSLPPVDTTVKRNPFNQTYGYDSIMNKDDRYNRKVYRSEVKSPENRVRSNRSGNDSMRDYQQDRRQQGIEKLKQAAKERPKTEQVTNVESHKPQLTATSGVRESEAVSARQSYSDYRNNTVRANETPATRQSYADYRNNSVRENESVSNRGSYSDYRNNTVRSNETTATRQSYSDYRNNSVRENESVSTRQSYSDYRNDTVRENEGVSNRQSYSDVRNQTIRENENDSSRKKYSDFRNQTIRENEQNREPVRYTDYTNRKVSEENNVKYVQEEKKTLFDDRKKTGVCKEEGIKRKICEPPKEKKKVKLESSPIVKRDSRKIFSYDHMPEMFRK